MYQDYEMTFTQTGVSPAMTSLSQLVTVTANGANAVDIGSGNVAKNIGSGDAIQIVFTVTTAMAAAGAATLQLQAILSAAEALTSPVTLVETAAIPKAELPAGTQISLTLPAISPEYVKAGMRYLGVRWVVASGPMNAAAAIRASVTVDPQTNG